MNIEEVDFGNGFIRIPKENTKTKQSRTVRIGKEILSDLKAFLRLEKRKKGSLFRSRQEKKLTTRRIENRRTDTSTNEEMTSVKDRNKKVFV